METKRKNKIKVLILGLIFLSGQVLFGQVYNQEFTTFKGKVKDKDNNKEIVFANISIVGTHVGTVTNLDGEFTIKVKKSSEAQEILFSHIGYDNNKISTSDLKAENNLIYLQVSSKPLNEVTVRPTDAKKLIRQAIEKVHLNYSNSPALYTGFYRETVKQRRDYISISEAIVDIYKQSYIEESDDKVKVFKGRKSTNVKQSDTLAFKLQGGPNVSLLLDIAKNPYVLIDEDVINNYDFELSDIVSVNNRLNYLVSFKPFISSPDYPSFIGKYYIDVQTLAITSVEFGLDLTEKELVGKFFVKKKPIGLKIIPISTSYWVNYKELNGKFYFNYARSEVKFKCNWKKKLFNSNYTVMSEIAMTDWATEDIVKFKNKESLKKNEVFADKVSAFTDEDFWGEHNYIEPDQSIEAAIKKYARKMKRK
ncbi:MAG: carboxypeptidase-like regulatory domain-containing protein [Bacteroidales bacterium]|nr:carboxypeptidase-like regulatory domain-containing protein [Bacteroidales bacterium]MBN2756199.1 carboxypeptidase-like regulatory domain-containing protein [Bacteroidales bacterium]